MERERNRDSLTFSCPRAPRNAHIDREHSSLQPNFQATLGAHEKLKSREIREAMLLDFQLHTNMYIYDLTPKQLSLSLSLSLSMCARVCVS